MAKLARGIRNNNPLNIELMPATHWRGQSTSQTDQFDTMADGLRAAFVIIRNYIRLHGLCNVQQIISRWAPPRENDTDAYIGFVSSKMGVSPSEPIRWTDRRKVVSMVQAMAVMESGVSFKREELDYAYRLAAL